MVRQGGCASSRLFPHPAASARLPPPPRASRCLVLPPGGVWRSGWWVVADFDAVGRRGVNLTRERRCGVTDGEAGSLPLFPASSRLLLLLPASRRLPVPPGASCCLQAEYGGVVAEFEGVGRRGVNLTRERRCGVTDGAAGSLPLFPASSRLLLPLPAPACP